MGPYNRVKEGIYTRERESLYLIQRRARKSKRVYLGVDEEGVY